MTGKSFHSQGTITENARFPEVSGLYLVTTKKQFFIGGAKFSARCLFN